MSLPAPSKAIPTGTAGPGASAGRLPPRALLVAAPLIGLLAAVLGVVSADRARTAERAAPAVPAITAAAPAGPAPSAAAQLAAEARSTAEEARRAAADLGATLAAERARLAERIEAVAAEGGRLAPRIDAAEALLRGPLAERIARLEAAEAPLAQRITALETALRSAEAAAGRAEATAQRAEALAREARDSAARRGPGAERFIAAALHLQASIATSRPWSREYRAMTELAPAGALPRPLAEVLGSHAARGLPTESELRERYLSLLPQLLARAPAEGSLIWRAGASVRAVVSVTGLVSPPPPSEAETALTGIAEQLRRGNLVGAVADAGTLDASLQPLLAGWIAQARARLAVEQAVQEVLLRALTQGTHPS
jgi:hypothetical protein